MKAADTPNATHMPRRCKAMCAACDETSRGRFQANSTAEHASDSSTSAHVQAAVRMSVASEIGTRKRKLNGLFGPPVK